ncbi:GNAT family N-acetyltransferase [Aestuariibius sp. 2305UL40-4]|uniref:GNAT family N-acetyltransferase n=1 Tax=Aestuariibius violaceus TaxID=3234132 RepID=UPI00345E8E80
MILLEKGRYAARLAETEADIAAAQALRHRAFFGREGVDADAFDAICRHVLVEDEGRLVCCYRVLPLAHGAEIGRSYSAQFYDLKALEAFDRPMIEMGRFCIDPDVRDPDVLRVAWGAMTRIVDEGGHGMLFGCSSFQGTDPTPYAETFGLLAGRHVAPKRWRPGRRARQVVSLGKALIPARIANATRAMPPLLRTYLRMGGWVSDHAVIDKAMGTLHVFTGVEVDRVPGGRKRSLRAIAG